MISMKEFSLSIAEIGGFVTESAINLVSRGYNLYWTVIILILRYRKVDDDKSRLVLDAILPLAILKDAILRVH